MGVYMVTAEFNDDGYHWENIIVCFSEESAKECVRKLTSEIEAKVDRMSELEDLRYSRGLTDAEENEESNLWKKYAYYYHGGINLSYQEYDTYE
jgi:hypothetical protein